MMNAWTKFIAASVTATTSATASALASAPTLASARPRLRGGKGQVWNDISNRRRHPLLPFAGTLRRRRHRPPLDGSGSSNRGSSHNNKNTYSSIVVSPNNDGDYCFRQSVSTSTWTSTSTSTRTRTRTLTRTRTRTWSRTRSLTIQGKRNDNRMDDREIVITPDMFPETSLGLTSWSSSPWPSSLSPSSSFSSLWDSDKDSAAVATSVVLSSKRARYEQTTVGALFCQYIKEELDVDVALLDGGSIVGDFTYCADDDDDDHDHDHDHDHHHEYCMDDDGSGTHGKVKHGMGGKAKVKGESKRGGGYKGNKGMSYAQLKRELPYPIDMVVVRMTKGDVLEAIERLRTCHQRVDSKLYAEIKRDAATITTTTENRTPPTHGHLQVDFDLLLSDYWYGEDTHDVVRVALPRDLLDEFRNIVPFMNDETKRGVGVGVGGSCPNNNNNDDDDNHDFSKTDKMNDCGTTTSAIDLILKHCCKLKWSDMLSSSTNDGGEYALFRSHDANNDRILDRDEVRAMIRSELGYDPEESEVDHMMDAVDADGDGKIDGGELSYILALMEERRWGRRRPR